jgi:hypothetical protein
MTKLNQGLNNSTEYVNHYRIRKEVAWFLFLILLSLTTWWMHDLYIHANWPPHEGKNLALVKSIKCPLMKYNLTKNEVPEIATIGGFSGHVDRKLFLENPACAASLYLYDEGTGIRTKIYVYDMQKRQQIAVIETTFEKHEEINNAN